MRLLVPRRALAGLAVTSLLVLGCQNDAGSGPPETGGLPGFRILGAQIDRALRSKDIEFFVQRVDGELECFQPMTEKRGICYGKTEGTKVKGVNIAVGDVVFFDTAEEYADSLGEYFQEGDRQLYALATFGDGFEAVLEPGSPVGRSHIMRQGDTLPGISERTLGSAARWEEIYAINKAAIGENPESIQPGLELKLPDVGRRLHFTYRASRWSLVAGRHGCPFNNCPPDGHWELWEDTP